MAVLGQGTFEATVVVKQGSNSAVQKDLENIGRQASVAASSIGSMAKPLSQLSDAAGDFEKSMEHANARVLAFGAAAGVIIGIKNAFTSLISEVTTFQDEMIKINSVMNLSSSSLSSFGDGLFEISKRTGQSIKEVSSAAMELSRQGLGASESLKRTETAMILVRIAGIDASEATKQLTAAVNSFQSEGIDASQVLDRIVKVQQNYAVSAQDLSDAITRAGETASGAGIKFNEFLGIVTAVQERTSRGGAAIGTAFNTIISRMQNDTRVDQIQKMLNIKLFDENQNPRPIIQQFQMISDAMSKMQDVGKKNAVMTAMAGAKPGNTLSSFMDDLKSAGSVSKSVTESAGDAQGTALRTNAALNTSIIAQFHALTASVEQFETKLGELGASEWAKNIVDGGNAIMNMINNLMTGSGLLASVFKGALTGLSSLIGPGILLGLGLIAKFFAEFISYAANSASSLLGMASAQSKSISLQKLMNDMLLSDSGLRDRVLDQTISQTQAEEILTKAVMERLAVTEALAAMTRTAAESTAASYSTGPRGVLALPTKAVAEEGAVAGFANPIASAVRKEAASVPMGDVRVGYDKRLINVANPSGVGVTNIQDEPNGLADVPNSRISAFNRNIPNFADNVFNMNTRNAQGQQIPEYSMLNKELAELVKGVRSGTTAFVEASKEVAKLSEAFGLSKRSVSEMNNRLDFARSNTYPEVKSRIESLTRPSDITELRAKQTAGLMDLSNPSNQAQAQEWKVQQELLSNLRNNQGSVSSGFGIMSSNAQAAQEAAKIEALKTEIRLRLELSKADASDALAGGAKRGFAYANRSATNLPLMPPRTDYQTGESISAITDVNKPAKTPMSQGKVMAISFIAPMVAGEASQAIYGRDSQETTDNMSYGQRFGKNAITDVTSSAAAGFALSGGNPLGAAVGALVGLATAAMQATKSLNDMDSARDKQLKAGLSKGDTYSDMIKLLDETQSATSNNPIDVYNRNSKYQDLVKRNPELTSMMQGVDMNDSDQVEALKSQLAQKKVDNNLSSFKNTYLSQDKSFDALEGDWNKNDPNKKDYSDLTANILQQNSRPAVNAVGGMGEKFFRDYFNNLDTSKMQNLGEDDGDLLDQKNTATQWIDYQNNLIKDRTIKNGGNIGDANETIKTLENLFQSSYQGRDSNNKSGSLSIIWDKIMQNVAGNAVNPESEKRTNDNRDFSDQVRGKNFEITNNTLDDKLRNGIQDKYDALNLQINNAIFTAMEDKKSYIEEESKNALSKSDRDFKANIGENMSSALSLLTDPDFQKAAGANTNPAVRDQLSMPVLQSQSPEQIQNLLNSLANKMKYDNTPGFSDNDQRTQADKAEAVVRGFQSSISNKAATDTGIAANRALSLATEEASEKLKAFNRNLDAIDSRNEFNRISEKGAMDTQFAHNDFALSRMTGTPWELGAAKDNNELNKINAKQAFDVSTIMDSTASEVSKILAQAQNTEALNNLTLQIAEWTKDMESKSDFDSPAYKDMAAKVSRDPTAYLDKTNSLSLFNDDNSNNSSAFSDTEKNRLMELARAQNQINLLKSAPTLQSYGINDKTTHEAIQEAMQTGASGDLITRDSVRAAGSPELQGQLDAMSNSVAEAFLQAVRKGVNQIKGVNTTAAVNRVGPTDDRSVQNQKDTFDLEFAQRKASLHTTDLKTQDDPLATQSQKMEASLADLRAQQDRAFGTFSEGMKQAFADINTEISAFGEKLGKSIPTQFRDGMAQAISEITMNTSTISSALMSAADGFLKQLNQAFSQNLSNQLTSGLGSLLPDSFGSALGTTVQQKATGGMIGGGSGIRDDVPAMLTGGEFVMKRSSVQKYGPNFMHALNSGKIQGYASGGTVASNFGGAEATGALYGIISANLANDNNKLSKSDIDAINTIKAYGKQSGPNYFIPGLTTPNGKYQGAIAGPQALGAFGAQESTSGAQDTSYQNGTSFGWHTEDESANLGIQGRVGSDISKDVYSAKETALNLRDKSIQDYLSQKQAEKDKQTAFDDKLIGTAALGVFSGVAGAMSAGYSNGVAANNNAGGWFGNMTSGVEGAFTGAPVNGSDQTFGGLANIFNNRGSEGVNSDGALVLNKSRAMPSTLTSTASSATLGIPDAGTSGDQNGMVLPDKPYTFDSNLKLDNDFQHQDFSSTDSNQETWQEHLKAMKVNQQDVPLDSTPMMAGGTVPTMLNSGEYVMSGAAKYSKSFLGKVNSGMLSGGAVGGSSSDSSSSSSSNKDLVDAITKLKDANPQVNITINSTADASGNSNSTESSNSKNSSQDNKDFANKVKTVVYGVITDERRQGGLLATSK